MVDTIQKNLPDADEHKALQESVDKSVDVVSQAQEVKVDLQQIKEMLGDLKQSLSKPSDLMQEELLAREKIELDRISHINHEQSKEIDSQGLDFKNDLNVLQTSVKKTTLQKESEVYSPYITPEVAKILAGWGEHGLTGRTNSYNAVAPSAELVVNEINKIIDYVYSIFKKIF